MSRRSSTNYQRAAWGFLAPGVVAVVLVLHLPVLYTVFLSFTDFNGLGDPDFVGIDNYVRMFRDPAVLTSIVNTLLWVVGTLVVPVGLGLVVAYLAFGLPGGAWLRVPFLVPYALSGVAVGVVFSFVLQNGGALSQALAFLGLPGSELRWLQDAPLNTFAMIIASAWQGVGVNALLFTVGLQSIPKEPLEAAKVDGAVGWRLFRYMIWPLLRPSTTIVVGLSIVNSLKTFDIVQSMTQGGPNRVSETLGVTMYRNTFLNSEYGLGAAVALFLTVITLAASIIYLRRQLTIGEPAKKAVRS
ncbi:carbohydrate ABC transporter membrane protein 1 (CUT1 family) [Labedella gwakjiensis]|uniref:Carbohydrate ABC transporter membrane protein 1 (CUT1 family) n=1 Tax=Labedella gwakjiensis TaxID=390269 RepID=A0A2P8GW70_9MICO|nr:sugar ABC transporter permease [Labedella gwakjiensis]PSL38221.1 carbohydrate ABC transporter membrane protein 1 (CUT1 family) [Labedella gwakjiensis]RUQ87238.1 sugar ABC transporter permease [Labedella gwakjiensis]